MNNMTIALIDIGSNSVRILYNDNKLPVKEIITTRLSQNMKDSILDENAIKRTANAVLILYKRAIERNIDKISIFATEAVRSAKNSKEFTKLIKNITHIDIDVVSGDRESELALLGALGKNATGGVIDIGGASTEIVYAKNGEIIYKRSLNIGAVKLFDAFKGDKERTNAYIKSKIAEYGEIPKGEYKFVGGTATSLASIVLRLKEYDSNKTDGTILLLNKLKEVESELYSLTVNEIIEKYPISKSRAEIIAGGVSLIVNILEYATIKKVQVSESDNLEGYLLTLN